MFGSDPLQEGYTCFVSVCGLKYSFSLVFVSFCIVILSELSCIDMVMIMNVVIVYLCICILLSLNCDCGMFMYFNFYVLQFDFPSGKRL